MVEVLTSQYRSTGLSKCIFWTPGQSSGYSRIDAAYSIVLIKCDDGIRSVSGQGYQELVIFAFDSRCVLLLPIDCARSLFSVFRHSGCNTLHPSIVFLWTLPHPFPLPYFPGQCKSAFLRPSTAGRRGKMRGHPARREGAAVPLTPALRENAGTPRTPQGGCCPLDPCFKGKRGNTPHPARGLLSS